MVFPLKKAEISPSTNLDVGLKSFSPIIHLDEPSDGGTVFSDTLKVSGWFYDDPSLVDSRHSSQIEFLLEDLSGRRSTLAAGLKALGKLLDSRVSTESAFISQLEIHPASKEVIDPEDNLYGRTFSFSGLINLAALLPADGDPRKLFTLSVLSRVGEQQAVSNPVTFSLAARGEWDKAYAGFISPSGEEIHSDYLLLHGWAHRRFDSLKKVSLFLNDKAVGEAETGVKSPEQKRALPSLPGANRCGFARLFSYEEVCKLGFRTKDLLLGLSVVAECEFKSGEKIRIIDSLGAWTPAPDRKISTASLRGEIESVSSQDRGFVEITGWAFSSSGRPLEMSLELSRKKIPLTPENDWATVRWHERSDIASRFPTLVGMPSGFTVDVQPKGVGRFPGDLRLVARDTEGAVSLSLGPKHMPAVIKEVFAQQLGVAGVKKFLGNSLSRALASDAGTERGNAYTRPHHGTLKPPTRILAAGQNLSAVEGAPKVFYEVLKEFAGNSKTPVEIVFVSPVSGRLRERLETLGVRVVLIPELDIYQQSWSRYQKGLERLGDLVSEFEPELIYANVLDSFWAADVASRHDIPCVWGIHESVAPAACFPDLDTRLRYRFFHALSYAENLLFVSDETAELFSSIADTKRCSVIPNAIDVAPIRQYCAENSVEDARKRLGISPTASVISIVGTTTERKGQDVFIREMATLISARNDKDFLFYIVGARESQYLDFLRQMVSGFGLDDKIHFIPENPQVEDYFRASDILAICSREESAPLVSLEAFAYGTPLVSTTVFGLAEQIEDGVNALAFDLDEQGALASKVSRLLDNPSLAAQLIAGAQDSINNKFSFEASMSRYKKILARPVPALTKA